MTDRNRFAMLDAAGIYLWAAAFAVLSTLLLSTKWWHPYCDAQADGPGFFAWGAPLPYAEPTGASSLEFTYMPHVLALDLALTFQGHHGEHAAVLSQTIAKLGGKPVSAKAKYEFPTAGLKSQADVLRFAATLEKGAVSAYLGAVPMFDNRDLSKAAASILGDEAMHWAVLRQALGEAPVPSAFVA
jgi:hypothetical protein